MRSIAALSLLVALSLSFTIRTRAQTQQSAKQTATDSLGDPLPDHALLRLGTTRFHAPSTVNDVTLSPAGDVVVTVGRQLIVWDAKTGKELWKANSHDFGLDFRGPAYGLQSVAFSPDGRYFLTPGKQNEVITWDVASGKHQTLTLSSDRLQNAIVQGQDAPTKAVELAADGRTLSVGNGAGVIVCDVNNGQAQFQVVNKITGPIDVGRKNKDRLLFFGHYAFGRFSPDGSTFAVVTSGSPNEIVLFNLVTGEELRHIALKDRLVRLAFSPDGKQIATTERDKAVRLYRAQDGKELWSHVVKLTNPNENYTSCVAFSPDGKLIAAGATDNHIHLLDPSTGDEVAAFSGGMYYPWGIAFTADSKTLFSSGWDGAVRRWDIAARKQLPLPAGVHATSVTTASPDGKTIAYKDDAGTIRLVHTQGGAEYDKLEHPDTHYSQLLFSPDGSQLAGGGTSGKNVHITIWNLRDKKIVHRFEWPKGKDPHSEVESLSYAPDGQRIAAAVFRQSAAYLFDLKTEKHIAKMKHGEVYGLSFSPDGKTLASAGWDKYVRFWDAQTGERRGETVVGDPNDNNLANGDSRMYTVCYAPEGGLLATAHLDGKVRVWNADGMTKVSEFQVPGRFVYGTISFSPDGLWLATGAQEGSISLWDAATGTKVWDHGRHQGYVYTVGFGRDSRTVLSGGEDGCCYHWDLRVSDKRKTTDLGPAWKALTEDDALAAYQAIWDLRDNPQRAVPLLAEKLRPVKSMLEPDPPTPSESVEEQYRLRELKRQLAAGDQSVQRSITVRRAISVLADIATAEAVNALKELANQAPASEISQLAARALKRLSTSVEQH